MKNLTKALLGVIGVAWAYLQTPGGQDILSNSVAPLIAGHGHIASLLGAVAFVLSLLHLPKQSA